MLTLKLQAKDYELTLLPSHKLKSDQYPKQSQDQSLLQAEHFRLKSCLRYISGISQVYYMHILGKSQAYNMYILYLS